MTIRGRLAILALFCLGAAAMSGCAASPKVNFYTLSPAVGSDAAVPAGTTLSIAVGPVTMSELVDRPQLVKRIDWSRVIILETQRWAEPLKDALPRLLAGNLSIMLGTDRVSAYLQDAAREADCRVLVDFQRFDATDDTVTIDALFTIRRSADAPPKTVRSQISEPIAGKNYEELVSAYSRALASLSRDIARVLSEEQGGLR
jgi:hypothetical protein